MGQQRVHMALLRAQAPPQGSDHNATVSARALMAALLPRRGRLRTAGFMLLWLAGISVSQTEINLLPADEL